jgi:hypothetical protein
MSRPHGHSAAGRIRLIEKKSTSSGIRTGDLPACSIVPRSTTLPRAPFVLWYSRLWHSEAWYAFAEVSEEPCASLMKIYRFIRNDSNNLPDYTVSSRQGFFDLLSLFSRLLLRLNLFLILSSILLIFSTFPFRYCFHRAGWESCTSPVQISARTPLILRCFVGFLDPFKQISV